MDISLEKIELVRERTGVSYAEAKEALEKNQGNAVDAIIELEGKNDNNFVNIDGKDWHENPIYIKLKEIIEKGNISRIIVKRDEKQILNFPVTAGVIGTVLIPGPAILGAIIGVVAAIGTQSQIEFVDDKGTVTDINGKVIGAYDYAKDITLKGIDKAQDLINKGVDKANEYGVTEKVEELIDKVEELGKKITKKEN